MHLDLENAQVLRPCGLTNDRLSFSEGRIVEDRQAKSVDLNGYMVLPGIIDVHGDGFEKHLAPRRGAMKQMGEGILAAEAEFAGNGITTAVMAQFVSWEGGLRSEEFAAQVFSAIRDTAPTIVTDIRPQMRLETHLLHLYGQIPEMLENLAVDYVVFNDHLPHDRLAQGRHPPRLVGQALKAGRNPDAHFQMLLDLHNRSQDVPAALNELCSILSSKGVRLGSHDDQTASDRMIWHDRGACVSEFPETLDAAEAAKANGDLVVLGAPNVVRGASHKGNVSAMDLVAMGLCDALASDYHYPSPRRAALLIAQTGVLPFETAWKLVSEGPARVLGLDDRGSLDPGRRADLVILDTETKRVAATLCAGRFSFLSGDIAERFFARR